MASSTATTTTAFVGAARAPFADFHQVLVTVVKPDGSEVTYCLLLADTEPLRQRGLMDVTSLAGYRAMVFHFQQPSTEQFYMYRTLLPLSIAFFDSSGRTVSTAEMIPCTETDPSRCPLYPSVVPYTDAIEVPTADGGATGLGVGTGSTVRLSGGCS